MGLYPVSPPLIITSPLTSNCASGKALPIPTLPAPVTTILEDPPAYTSNAFAELLIKDPPPFSQILIPVSPTPASMPYILAV